MIVGIVVGFMILTRAGNIHVLKTTVMKTTKDQKNDPESYRTIYFQLGVIIALLCVLYAFEYKTYERHEVICAGPKAVDVVVEELIPITKHPVKKTPPRPAVRIIIVEEPIEIPVDPVIDAFGDDETGIDWNPDNEPEPEIVEVVPPPIYIAEHQPSFVGGTIAMNEYYKRYLNYPKLAQETGIQGMVYVKFVVEKDGSLSNVTLLRGIGGGCDEESLRLVEEMPKWNPGLQNGRPVRVMLTLPIKFTLR